MSTEIVADKYSSAMLELAQEQGNLVTTEENLLYVASVLNEQPELVGSRCKDFSTWKGLWHCCRKDSTSFHVCHG